MRRNRASAAHRGRTAAVAAMEEQLLGKQLSSITKTLLKASQRRDAEVQRRTASQSPVTPAAQDTVSGSDLGQYDLDLMQPSSHMDRGALFGGHASEVNGPKKMLAEIEMHMLLADRDDPKNMLADIERTSRQNHKSSLHDAEDDLEVLKSRLMGMLVSSPNQGPSVGRDNIKILANNASAVALDEEVIAYVIALQLEKAGLQRKELQAETKYLSSPGPDGHEAYEEKYKALEQANKEWDRQIEQTLREEEHYRSKESKVRLSRRLIVFNIATDASKEDLEAFFYGVRFMVQEIYILPSRDPVKRTQVAHVDMFTREAAIQASYTMGNIFGLIPKIELAVAKES